MANRLQAQASDDAAILTYGLHSALVLINRMGQRELQEVFDPRPARHLYSRPDPDPFEDPNRPLRLTLGSDCRWLDGQVYEDLIKLSFYPKVDVDLVPGLPGLGYRYVHSAAIRRVVGGRLASYEVSSTRSPQMVAAGMIPNGGIESLRHLLGLSESRAGRFALDIAVHEALGNDFLVTGLALPARHVKRGFWPNEHGLCSPEEAFGLAGVKARMYQDVPLRVFRPDSQMLIGVGRWRDQAAMRSAWGLRRALTGALSPTASAPDRSTREHLIAIRRLLVDALVARDAVYRLTRRQSHDTIRRRPAIADVTPGVRGNDLLQLLHYHTVAMLNHVFAATDNLAWVIVRKTGTTIRRDREVGFGSLVGSGRQAWARSGSIEAITSRIDASEQLPFVLAAREIRNALIHRDGVPYGMVEFQPPPAPVRDVCALWLDEKDWDPATYAAVGARAELMGLGLVVITFLRLVDELWKSLTMLLNEALILFEWPSSNWLRGNARYAEGRRIDRAWRERRQALCFRFQP